MSTVIDKINEIEADLNNVSGQGKSLGSSKNAAMIYQLQRQMSDVVEILKQIATDKE